MSSRFEGRDQDAANALQSVMDEEVDDTPATVFDREAETFHTQKSYL